MSRLTRFLAAVVVTAAGLVAVLWLSGNLSEAGIVAVGAIAAVVAAMATLAAVCISLPPWLREQRMRLAGRQLAAEAYSDQRRLARVRKWSRERVVGGICRLSIADFETMAIEAEKRRKGGFVGMARRHGLTMTPNPKTASEILRLAETSVEQFKAGKAATDAFIDSVTARADQHPRTA